MTFPKALAQIKEQTASSRILTDSISYNIAQSGEAVEYTDCFSADG